jgi:hypothetical protein
MEETLKLHLLEFMKHKLYGTDDALCILNILMCILILQYKHNKDPMYIYDYITSIISGLYLADLIQGLIHLFMDNNKFENKFIKDITDDFKRHHITPTCILQENNIALLKQTSIVPGPLCAILFNSLNNTRKKHILTQIICIYALHLSQLTHKYAHYMNHATDKQKKDKLGKFLQFLQDYNITISAAAHKKHHKAKLNDVNFCIINGWANPLLNEIVAIPIIHKAIWGKYPPI